MVKSRSRRWLWAAATAAIAALTGAGVWWSMRGATPIPVAGPTIRAELPVPLNLPFLQGKDDRIIALSPDGRTLASVSPSHNAIVLRDLETGDTRTVVEGGEVGQPFFSPDSQFLAFVQGGGGTFRRSVWGSIKKIAITGGAATVIADGIIGLKGSDWAEDGYIYYCPAPGMGLWRAPAERPGTPERLTEPDAKQGEKTHRHPFVLPGGHAVLYSLGTSRDTTFDNARIEVLDLRDRSRHRLVEGGFAPMYVPTGHLVYQRAGQLLAVKFDPATLSTSGAPVVVADGVANHPEAGTSYHTFSRSGLLMFIPAGPKPVGQFVAVDRQGRSTKLAEGPTQLTSGSLSPDGRRLALDPDGATQQIAILDFSRNLIQPLTFEWDNANPIWTPDGTRLVYRSNTGGGARRLFWQAADGSDKPEALMKVPSEARDEIPTSVFDKLVLFDTLDANSKVDVWVLSLDDRTSRPLVQTPFDEGGASFSPDGRWVTYQSNQSGRWEIWLQRYPLSGSRVQVSRNGGTRPTWMPDGRSIVFEQDDDMMMAAISDAGPGTPVKLFSLEPNDIFLDVTRDDRILVRRTTTPPTPSLALIVNWFDHVRQASGRTR
jgi:Tol biopolymer transport system component